MFSKIASQDVNGILIKCASSLRDLAAENISLRDQLADLERKDHAEKIAAQAVSRGIMDESEAFDYAKGLAEGDKDLEMVEEFVSRTVQGVPLGEPLQKTASDDLCEGETLEARFATSLLSSEFI